MLSPRSCAGLALVLAASMAACAPLIPAPEPAPASYPGFDTWRYPGAEKMRIWREESPYRWVGYYLPSPCHRARTWEGRRAELEGMGWGIAVLYVGQQTWEDTPEPEIDPERLICSRRLLTAEQGRIDAGDAIEQMLANGFLPGSIVFLNVERMETVRSPMAAYYTAWVETVLADGRFIPGTYAHRRNADTLFGLSRLAFDAAGRMDLPPFWVAGGTGFSLDAEPTDVGLPFTTIWQGRLDVELTWGGRTLMIDENVSMHPNPSASRLPVAERPRR